jgi:hypothetical protein
VRPLKSSIADRGDVDRLRDRLRADGYLYLPGLLDPDEVVGVHDAMLRAIGELGWTDEGRDPTLGVPSSTVRAEHQPGYNDGCAALQALEPLHRLAHDRALVDVACELLGERVTVVPLKVPRVKWPDRDELTTGAHQDWPYFQGGNDVLTMWVPMHDCPREVGGLRVLEGSHRRGLLPMVPDLNAGGLRVEVSDDDPAWRSTDYRRGDVLVFHCLTVHAALPNRSDRLRVSVDYRYSPATDPIGSLFVHPQFHPAIDDWPELTSAWSTRRWIELPADATIVESSRPPQLDRWHIDLVPPPSRVLGTR